jgi:hypothetical protein
MEPNKMIEQKSIVLQLVPRGWEVSIFLRVNGVILSLLWKAPGAFDTRLNASGVKGNKEY